MGTEGEHFKGCAVGPELQGRSSRPVELMRVNAARPFFGLTAEYLALCASGKAGSERWPQMLDWNVVITVHEDGYRSAKRTLEHWGAVAPTPYYNVLVMRVADVADFLTGFQSQLDEQPGLLNDISRVIPCTAVFDFQTAEVFEFQAREAALSWVPELAGKSFHVRMHRRGFKHRLSSPEEERFLDAALLESLERAGSPGRITFEDPDAIIALETVDQRAGLSLWRRADLERYEFLGLD